MENDNIDEQIKSAHAEALKTGNWLRYNRLTILKANRKQVA